MEKRREGAARGARPAGGMRGSGPGADTAPGPTEAPVGPATSLSAPAATLPGHGCSPAGVAAPPLSPPIPSRPVPFRSPSRRRGPAPTSARRRAAASRAQSSGRVFHICKKGSREAVSAGRGRRGGRRRRTSRPGPLSPCCGRRAAPAGQEELRRRLPRLRLAAEGKGRAPPRPDPPARGSTPGPARPPPRGRLLPGPRPLPAAPRRCPRPSRRRPLGAPRRPRRPLKAAGGRGASRGLGCRPTTPGFTLPPGRTRVRGGSPSPAPVGSQGAATAVPGQDARQPGREHPAEGPQPPLTLSQNGETEARDGFSTCGIHSPTQPTVPPRSSPEATEVLATAMGATRVGMWADLKIRV